MSDFTHILRERMECRGFTVNDHQLAQFSIYHRELKDWNTRVNLTALNDDIDIINKHFIDSILLVKYQPIREKIKLADVGTGAGFPGIPLKLYKPDIYLMLIESVGKKAEFLKHMVSILELEDVQVLNERAEIIGRWKEYRESYDLAVARCVAPLQTLVEYCLPLVSVDGRFIAYKGSEAEAEVENAENAIRELSGRFKRLEHDNLSERVLVFIDKVGFTPDKYPRRPGMPKKKPL
jgi:16S rRNA (guanine527-N7)-methyltransferase